MQNGCFFLCCLPGFLFDMGVFIWNMVVTVLLQLVMFWIFGPGTKVLPNHFLLRVSRYKMAGFCRLSGSFFFSFFYV